ncbi:MAG: serine/threonine protein kinase, partial [Thermoanaerobaculia bacterium]|nr:serine/threonine protein kinase [Thermoanaerobaculia bacterium]
MTRPRSSHGRSLTLVGPSRRFKRKLGPKILLAAFPALAALLLLSRWVREASRQTPHAVDHVLWVLYGLVVILVALLIFFVFRTVYLRRLVIRARAVSRYIFDEELGEGAFGVVYKAHSVILKRPVAVKLLRGVEHKKELIERFEREARLACQLTHPNTVEVYDYGRSPHGVHYHVMEFIDGVTLAELILLEDALPQARAVAILRQICASLAEAHEIGLIHRDLTPANVMLTVRGGVHDFVKVLDFGIAKDLVTGEGEEVSAAGFAVGTPVYVAPERLRDPSISTPRTDLYSLGAVAFALLSGREVFRGSAAETREKTLNRPPASLSVATSHPIAPALEALVASLLSKYPDSRPRSAHEVIERLDQLEPEIGAWTEAKARRWWLENRGSLRRRREEVLDDLP